MATVTINGEFMTTDQLHYRLVKEKEAFKTWLNAGNTSIKFERKYALGLHYQREFSDGMSNIINEDYCGNYNYAKPAKYSKQRTALIKKIRREWFNELPEFTFISTQCIIEGLKFHWNKKNDAANLAKKNKKNEEYILGDRKFKCANCIACFEDGKDNCKTCGFDMNQWNYDDECDWKCARKGCENKGSYNEIPIEVERKNTVMAGCIDFYCCRKCVDLSNK
jgi:hypothetical protein